MISIIVAIDQHNAIGRQGQLLCHLPDDLKHFKQLTDGHPVIMGRRTYLSLPKRPLPNRRNIVISDIKDEQIEGAEVVDSIEAAIQLVKTQQTSVSKINTTSPMTAVESERTQREEDNDFFIIGGGMVYRQFMPLADKLYITHIHHSWHDADTFFPLIDPAFWQLQAEEHHPADERNPYPFTFAEYTKQSL